MSRSSADSYEISFELSEAQIEKILEATTISPRAANLQHFQVRYFTRGPQLDKVSMALGDAEYLGRCSLALFFFVDLRTTAEWMKSRGVSSPFLNTIGYQYAFADASIALQSAATAAESLGLQTRILSNCLQRAKAANVLFSCPEGIVPSLVLTVGKGQKVLPLERFNLNATDFCVPAFAPWKSYQDVYVSSGKEEADARYLEQRPEIAARGLASNPAHAIAQAKYKDYDMDTFAKNLDELMASNLDALKRDK